MHSNREIKIVDGATGNVLNTLSTVVTGDDFSMLQEELLEKLEKLKKEKN